MRGYTFAAKIIGATVAVSGLWGLLLGVRLSGLQIEVTFDLIYLGLSSVLALLVIYKSIIFKSLKPLLALLPILFYAVLSLLIYSDYNSRIFADLDTTLEVFTLVIGAIITASAVFFFAKWFVLPTGDGSRKYRATAAILSLLLAILLGSSGFNFGRDYLSLPKPYHTDGGPAGVTFQCWGDIDVGKDFACSLSRQPSINSALVSSSRSMGGVLNATSNAPFNLLVEAVQGLVLLLVLAYPAKAVLRKE